MRYLLSLMILVTVSAFATETLYIRGAVTEFRTADPLIVGTDYKDNAWHHVVIDDGQAVLGTPWPAGDTTEPYSDRCGARVLIEPNVVPSVAAQLTASYADDLVLFYVVEDTTPIPGGCYLRLVQLRDRVPPNLSN